MSLFDSLLKTIRPAAPGKIVHAPDGVAILTHGDNASIAYLLAPYLDARGIRFTLVDAAMPPASKPASVQANTLIISRYLPAQWLRPVQEFKSAGGTVIYFMDDDLMDPRVTRSLPRPYQRKIATLATKRRAALETLCDEFWVSSHHLAEKYRDWSPRLLLARPLARDLEQDSPVTVCYHGTASHLAEIRWLVGVIERLQERCANTRFELFGGHDVNRLFRHIPRVSVLHPMDWANYQAYTRSVRRDIALAPLLPDPFNAARGATKFFDFARMGAVGLYTDVAPYRGYVRAGVDGLLLENDPEAWVANIQRLAEDRSDREAMAQSARQRALADAEPADRYCSQQRRYGTA